MKSSCSYSDEKRYLSYPAREQTEALRHHFVMVRRKIPRVPRPDGTPLPTSTLDAEQRGRMFSSYLRPWVLHEDDCSPHVPLLYDIDILISDELLAFEAAKEKQSRTIVKNRRLRGKQPRPATASGTLRYVYTKQNGEALARSYADAWKDYRCKHVVSKWAARIIQQFNASHLADSLEAEEADQSQDNRRERNPIDNSWMQLTSVKDILEGTASAERRRAGGKDKIQISAHAHLVEEAKSISEKLWSLPRTLDVTVDISNKHISKISTSFEKPAKTKADAPKEPCDNGDKKAGLVYRKFSIAKANEWLRDLKNAANKTSPSDEQLTCLEAVIQRCAIEAVETDENREFRSEPLRMLLHGVPGAFLNASRM